MKRRRYLIELFIDDEEDRDYWTADVVNLPGCVTQGADLAEALRNTVEVIELYEKSEEDREKQDSVVDFVSSESSDFTFTS